MKGGAVWGSTSRPCQDCRQRREGRVGVAEEGRTFVGGGGGYLEGKGEGWVTGHLPCVSLLSLGGSGKDWCQSSVLRHHSVASPSVRQPRITEKPER